MRTLTIIDDAYTALCPELADAILEREHRSPSAGSNNVGGWKSASDVMSWHAPAFRALRSQLETRLGKTPVTWAMVNRRGSYHRRHTHGMSYECGLIYVTTGNPAIHTIFEHVDLIKHIERHPYDGMLPNGIRHSTSLATGSWEITPRTGRLVLFPGSLPHSVPVYAGEDPRITIAFEVRP